MIQSKTVDSKVLEVLRECPKTRYNDMLLILEYYNRFSEYPIGDFSFDDVVHNYKGYGLPCFESIRRARQRVQSLFPEISRNPQCCNCNSGGVTIVINV